MQIETNYEDALARRYPEQVVIAIAKDEKGQYNPITLGWTMLASHEPPMMAIAVGKERYSLEAIRHCREFVVSMVSSEMAEDAVLCGTKSGRDLDKLTQCGAKTQPASKIDSLILSEAVANFECKLESELVTGDHVLLVGRVVASHMNESPAADRLFSLGHERLGGVVPG